MQKATRQLLKEHNRDLVLNIFFENTQISRAEIARITHLTRTTVSDIVSDLISGGLVNEVGLGISIGGKSPILLSLVENSRFTIGLDLAYNLFQGAVVDLRGQICQVIRLPIENATGERALEATFNILDQLVRLPYHSLVGIGVGAPGLVNSKEGVVVNAVNMEWQDLPLGQILCQRYGLPVIVLNDCQAAAMGELKFGGNQPTSRNMVVVRVGHGIGAGLIIDGQIFQGDGGSAGEIGHTLIQGNGGLLCRCGRTGCLETLASTRAVIQQAERLAEGPNPAQFLHHIPLTLDELIAACDSGEAAIQEIIQQAGYYLGLAIASLVSTLNIHQIVLMGEMTRFGRPWLEAVQRTVEQSTLARLGQDTHIQISALHENDVILGASAVLAGNNSLLFK